MELKAIRAEVDSSRDRPGNPLHGVESNLYDVQLDESRRIAGIRYMELKGFKSVHETLAVG